jgi:Ser/Thr protein kinase RdoA (MazF antagonist)
MLSYVLSQFGFVENTYTVTAFGSGLINNTWLAQREGKKYIVQRINQQVFKTPQDIDTNISLIAAYVKQHHPGYLFTVPLATVTGETILINADGAFRIFEFIEGSHTYNTLQQPQQAYEAAKQFGKFTRLLNGFNVEQLNITLPDFHNLSLRQAQFEKAVEEGNPERRAHAAELIKTLNKYTGFVKVYEAILVNPAFKKRVTHHDTKISNVLFNSEDKGMCVIDLDTVMPGYFISDVGDIMRTYLAVASEEETDFTTIAIRDEYFDAVVEGYLGEMAGELSAEEMDAFVYAGEFMIYMQALRFLADYLNNDVYYGAKYPLHNFNRAANQVVLLEDLVKKEALFTQKVKAFIKK